MLCTQLRTLPYHSRPSGSIIHPGASRPAIIETSKLDSLPGPLVGQIELNPRMDSVDDIDARLDEQTNAIHEAMSTSVPKSKPARQPLVSIPPTIIANIREKDMLRRQWQIDRDSVTKN